VKLLTRTSIYYFIFSLLLFIVGGFVFYNVIQSLFDEQIDETLMTEKQLIVEQINYSDSLPDFRTVFGHMIEVSVFDKPLKKSESIKDTVVYDKGVSEMVLCRHLTAANTSLNKKGYVINIYKPIDETRNLLTAILVAMAMLFVSLMGSLLLVNYFISSRAWIPFYRTLRSLGNYNINQVDPLILGETSISEFKMLNKAIERMSKKIRRDFLNLKEFNENASHELQTPLAIIKSKLELLIQNEHLSEEQVQLIRSVHDAAARISKLNQGLLLISKIENNQFQAIEEVDLSKIIQRNLENFDEIIRMKEISLSCDCSTQVIVSINKILGEMLISNLVSNSIRHNIQSGKLSIKTDRSMIVISNSGHPLNIEPQLLFQRFRKSDRTTDSVGLGLAIVKQIVDYFNWRIEYEFSNGIHTVTIWFSPASK